MIDLPDYFDPVSIEAPGFEYLTGSAAFPHSILVHTESNPPKVLENIKVAILGVPEGRNSPNSGSAAGPDSIRKELYRLARIPGKLKVADLGNLKPGTSFNDSLAGLADVLTYLFSEGIFPLIIGGSSAVVPAIDTALSKAVDTYSVLAVDPRIDFSSERRDPDSYNYLSTITSNPLSSFFKYINIGYQTYFNDRQVINRFLKRRAELIRLGDARQAINLMEPYFRDTDVAIFDISAVRQSDAPGTFFPSANGFYGEEICLLARYAGISDYLKVFGLFEVNPGFDMRSMTSGLAAQIIWFFLEGYSQKQYETPALSSEAAGRFIRYHVRLTDLSDDLIFVRSNLTDRWWMEIESAGGTKKYIACAYDDYLKANKDEVPERWVKATERLDS